MKIEAADGVQLEAEIARSDTPRAVAVLCHPHPQYGGTMRSMVTSALFAALPSRGIVCVRFNFRGVEGSDGHHTEGEREPLDVVAAIDAASAQAPDLPVAVVGWSFGADMALTVADERITQWVAIAPPLRFRPAADYKAVADDTRRKLLILAAHDEFRAPDEIRAETADWRNTRVEVVAGASHFFVGRTEQVVDLTADFVQGAG